MGCANQRNLAAMVSEPRDLLTPRADTPRSSQCRNVVWNAYIAGKPTSAERTQDERTAISTVKSAN
jgi:pilus assembly protein CpaD